VKVIPDDHPSLPKLRDAFGDHTFFLNDSGLTIIEPLEQDPLTGELVKVASWDNADPPHLVAHTPEETDVAAASKLLGHKAKKRRPPKRTSALC
jgi:hypothetical protein